jgi:polysaccharide export outer membrane protein
MRPLHRLIPLLGCVLFALVLPLSAGQSDYIVRLQDVLTVTVWNQKDLSGKFTVDSDGTFMFPLVGRVHAGGQALRDVEAELKRLLADGYVRAPQVSITVENARTGTVYVLGEVKTPGTYPLAAETTVLDALARAGSTTDRAGDVAVITRPHGDGPAGADGLPGPETIKVSLSSLQTGSSTLDIQLRDGDRIFVPRVADIYVAGQVKNPGGFALREQLTVLQALALAGGVTDRGSQGRIKIIRHVGTTKTELKASLTDLVKPGDTVVVGERLF